MTTVTVQPELRSPANHEAMSPDQFAAWLSHNGLSVSEAARLLDMSRNSIYFYRDGVKPIPRTVQLACAAIQAGIRTWPPETIVFDRRIKGS